MVRLQHDLPVVELAGDSEQITRDLIRLIKSASGEIEEPQIGDRWREVSALGEPEVSAEGSRYDIGMLR